MPNPVITVPVNNFVAAGAGFCSINPLTVANPPGTARVSVDPSNASNIRVTNPGGRGQGQISLDFSVTPAASFTVCGFAITTPAGDNSSGNSNFSLTQISGNVITLKNNYSKGKTTWKLFIAIMNSSQQLGIIDPGIDNTDDA